MASHDRKSQLQAAERERRQFEERKLRQQLKAGDDYRQGLLRILGEKKNPND